MAASDPSKKRKASAPAAVASTKKSKKTSVVGAKVDSVAVKSSKPAVAKKTSRTTKETSKKLESTKKSLPKPADTDLDRFDSESGSEADEDQTAALLAGFSSDSEAEAEDNALAAVEGLQLPVPEIPSSAELDTRLAAANSSDNKADGDSEPGVVYVSRIPHGFYEHQMTGYFSQFGDITRLRMARNRRTGASKHYAFIEFAHMEVARIVAETMNNYLMFGHSLKVRVVEPARVHPELFKGANTRFRPVPWNRIERTRLAKTDRKGWEKRVGKEERRRADKKRLLSELGYNFNAPELRSVDSVPVKDTAEIVPEAEVQAGQDTPKAIDSKPAEQAITVDELIGATKTAGLTAIKATKVKTTPAGKVKVKKTKKTKA